MVLFLVLRLYARVKLTHIGLDDCKWMHLEKLIDYVA